MKLPASLHRPAIGIALLLLAGSCGKKGDPLPPLRLAPAAVEELRVDQRGSFIYLEWAPPRRNTDGSLKVDLREAEVLRRVVLSSPEATASGPLPGPGPSSEEEAPGRSTFEREAISVARIEVPEKGGPLSFRDPWDPSWEGKRLQYAVRHWNRKGRSSPLSPLASLEPLAPLSPPGGVAARAGDGFVLVSWEDRDRPESGPGGRPEAEVKGAGTPPGARYRLGFNIYRRNAEGSYGPEPLNREPVENLEYEDRLAVFGVPLCYAVRKAARPLGGGVESVPDRETPESAPPVIESADSAEACLTPIDTFAPSAPADLVAVTTTEGILVSWKEVEAADLVGYRLYRSLEPDGPFEPLTPLPLTAASFIDRTARPGILYYYAATAVDRAEPPNESERREPVSARMLRPF